MTGQSIAEKMGVGLLLSRLALIPDQYPDIVSEKSPGAKEQEKELFHGVSLAEPPTRFNLKQGVRGSSGRQTG